nr:hypothetical protein [Tanacetum cinerariifolium]
MEDSFVGTAFEDQQKEDKNTRTSTVEDFDLDKDIGKYLMTGKEKYEEENTNMKIRRTRLKQLGGNCWTCTVCRCMLWAVWNGINRIRMYGPNPAALQALSGTNIEFILNVPNGSLEALADQNAAAGWVRDNILNYPDVKFRYISVGNEVSDEFLRYVLPAMQNVQRAIYDSGRQIKVSTATYTGQLQTTYPPKLSYALFTKPDTGDQYKNLFDAMYDAHLAAQRRLGGADVPIVVSESGWPSAEGNGATMENAGTYYRNLIAYVKGRSIETYLFAMFDEDQKPGEESEKHFGVFFPNQSSKYNLSF